MSNQPETTDTLQIDVIAFVNRAGEGTASVVMVIDPECLELRNDGFVQIWLSPTDARRLAMDLGDSASSSEDKLAEV